MPTSSKFQVFHQPTLKLQVETRLELTVRSAFFVSKQGQPHVHSKARMLSSKNVDWLEPINQRDLKDILNLHQNRSKNIFIGKNAMTRGHGNCSL